MKRRPSYQLIVNGQNITPKINGRLINLTLTDERGDKSDQLDVVLSDHDGRLAIPPRHAEIQVWIGWEEQLTYKGLYILDEAVHSGPPDVLTLRARSADFISDLKQKRQQSWHKKTLGEILSTVAARSGLEPVVHPSLANKLVEHIDQTSESDHNLLLRLGHRWDAMHAIKNGKLLFAPAGNGQTASGIPVPGVTLVRRNGDTHEYRATDRPNNYTGVQAHWHDVETGKQVTETAGTDKTAKVIRHTYPTQGEAISAAAAEWRALNRAQATLTLNLAEGDAGLFPEMPVTVVGYKPEIDGTGWVMERVVHSLNESGYTTRGELEVKG